MCRAKQAPAPASSVSISAASASIAASCGVNGGVSRVLTRPGTGALARTMSWAATVLSGAAFDGLSAHEASTRRMSRTVRTVPPTVPVTLDRPDRGR